MARARKTESSGRLHRPGSGAAMWLVPPVEFRLDPLELSPQPLTWHAWLTGHHGRLLRFRNDWQCHAHFYRDNHSLTLLFSFAAKVNWLHPFSRLMVWLDFERDRKSVV